MGRGRAPLGDSKVLLLPGHQGAIQVPRLREREFFIDNILVRIHFIIVMIMWTGLAPWEFVYSSFRATRVLSKSRACGSEAGSYLRLIDFVCHSTLGLRVINEKKEDQPSASVKSHQGAVQVSRLREREFFIDNILVQIHFIIVMIRCPSPASAKREQINSF